MAGAAPRTEGADDVENQVFGRDAVTQLPARIHRQGLGLLGRAQRLRGQHVLHFGGANAERERPKRAVGAGVAIPAHDGEAGQRDAHLRADDVDNALTPVAVAIKLHPELFTVAAHGFQLLAAQRARVNGAAIGRHVVVHRRKGQVGPAHGAPRLSQTIKRLGTGDLVNQVAIDIEQHAAPFEPGDDMVVPNLFKQCSRHECRPILRPRRAAVMQVEVASVVARRVVAGPECGFE